MIQYDVANILLVLLTLRKNTVFANIEPNSILLFKGRVGMGVKLLVLISNMSNVLMNKHIITSDACTNSR